MVKKVGKDLTDLSQEEVKVIISVMVNSICDVESEIAENFKEYFTTESFFKILSEVVDRYLYDFHRNPEKALKIIKEQHRASEKSFI